MYYSIKKKTFTNYSGQPIPETVSITFAEQEILEIVFDQDISDLRWTFTASYKGKTILYTGSSGIQTIGNKMEIAVDAYTKEFQDSVTNGDISTVIELYGVDSAEHVQHVILLPMIARYSNISGATPPELILPPSGNFITPEQLQAAVKDFATAENLKKSTLFNMNQHLIQEESSVFTAFSCHQVYFHHLKEDETLSVNFDLTDENDIATIELWLIMPDPAISFSLPQANWFEEPDFSAADTLYCVVFRKCKFGIFANIAYTVENWSNYEQQQL